MITYKNFQIDLVDIFGLMLDFKTLDNAEKFLTDIGSFEACIWHNNGGELCMVEYEEIKDRVPAELGDLIDSHSQELTKG